jgi:XTP/dITP diphosphohydrolase
MARRLVLATRNAHKVHELRDLLADLPVEVVSAAELDLPDVVEDGDTLQANALKKARELASACGELCVADDTGLFVDALDGAPGVYSARYAGEDATYADNCRKLLAALRGEANRAAHFATVMAMVDPASGRVVTVEGRVDGTILEAARGEGGFGYDPVFLVAGDDRTLAEMSLSEKNRISHRARAVAKLHEALREHLAVEGETGDS